MMRSILCALFLLAAAPAAAEEAPLLHGMFADHAILQRGAPIPVWGHAKPGATVTVSLAAHAITAQAGADGRWSGALPAMDAGGPYTLAAHADSGVEQTVHDVLIGDVYLCSGQSNMSLQVERALDSWNEINSSDNDAIRMATIDTAASPVPRETFAKPVHWLAASPATVPGFSATCFYFARELQKTVNVPIGLVVSAWGGSWIETWMSSAALRSAGGYDAKLDIVKLYAADPMAGATRWGIDWEAWWKSKLPGAVPWSVTFDDSTWPIAPPVLGVWDKWGVPELVNRAGMVWYRTHVMLTAEQAAQGETLTIGKVDEIGQVWVDGRFLADGTDSTQGRVLQLPAGLLHAGDNSIAVNVLNTYSLGGLTGPPQVQAIHLKGGGAVPLQGPWRYSLVPKTVGDPPRAPWEPLAGMSMAYNAMIAPIAPYGFRGVVWYQGESNAGQADAYQRLLSGLMADWRGAFGAKLPFLIVQLPSYGPPSSTPVDPGIARLREAERLAAAADPNAGLAVTIDIGERGDAHPANKQDVGRRLARLARHVVYGQAVIASGPVVRTVRWDKGHVVVEFGDVSGGLVAYSADNPIGFELCGAAIGTCRFAASHIAGTAVVLVAAKGSVPIRLRYCWGESPVCTLYDRSGAPAGPFEIAVPPVKPLAKTGKPLYKKR